VTGIKILGRQPRIIDDRKDKSVPIIAIDFREKDLNNPVLDDLHGSNFKRMSENMWEKINTIRKVHGHNTTNESPITAPPTVSVIVVKQLTSMPQSQMNNNNAGFPNMGFNSPMLNMYQQEHNYNLLAAAAQSLMSAAATNYNPMYSQPFSPPPMHPSIPYNMMPYVHSPQMMQRQTPTPIPQQNYQHQHQQHQQHHHRAQSPPSTNTNFVKRKPVRSTDRQTMSPQIQQRLGRRKSAPASVSKKKVRFKDEPTIYYIEPNEVESDDEESGPWKNEDPLPRKFSHHRSSGPMY
jgi:hypothetical protein